MSVADPILDPRAFPTLDDEEMRQLQTFKEHTCEEYRDGQKVYEAGQPNMSLYVVKSGAIDIRNPSDENKIIVSHGPGQFSGDIDLLTGRPILVDGVARGRTEVLKVPGGEPFRKLLNRLPRLSEKLIVAMYVRRQLLEATGSVGVRVIGPADCPATNEIREFLYKNFVPMIWTNSDSQEGRAKMCSIKEGAGFPMVELRSGDVLTHPSLHELAERAGIWKGCPSKTVDLAIVGAGPAGLAAGVYAASEGLDTIVLDCLGLGGQAGASSRIENFIGFPAGLTGYDLATRGVMQLLKFGGKMVAPVHVDGIESSDDPRELLTLRLSCGTRITATAVLAASGVKYKDFEAEGAKKFERIGIYHACTAVEAAVCDQEPVAVVGGGNSAGQAAMYLAECCRNRTVHLIIRGPKLELGMSEYLRDRIDSMPNIIKVHLRTVVTAVRGESKIEEIVIRHLDQSGDGSIPAEKTLKCAAVFVFIGAEPNTSWIPKSIAKDEHGYVLIGAEVVAAGKWPLKNRAPCPLETSIPRLLAGGDVRAGSTKRVGFAVGDGSLAVSCTHYLRSQH